MNEFFDAVYETLNAETGIGKELDGLTVLKNLHAGMKDPCVVIARNQETNLGQNDRYKSVEGRMRLAVFVEIDKKVAGTQRETFETTAETWARKVEKVVMRNPKLTSVAYPTGITNRPNETQFIDKDYGETVENAGTFTFARMQLSAKYIYRDGTIVLE
ncbi:MAG: hypothetical protein ACE5I1_11450 [bacterium]